MNTWENLIADTPTFGGWYSDGDKLVFTQFFPNNMKGLPNFTDLLISWARSRVASAKELGDIVHKSDERARLLEEIKRHHPEATDQELIEHLEEWGE